MVKLEVSTHSGDVDVLEVEEYDAHDMEEKRNNNEFEAIKIGNNVYSRIDLKNIKVIDQSEEIDLPTE